MFLGIWQDPRWTEISASLRKGKLYVKMPREKVKPFLEALEAESQDLYLKEVLESPRSFVLCAPVDDWNQDLITLKDLRPSVVVTEFILVLEAGLRNEDLVDWIARIGGPPREDSDTLESLFGGRIPNS